MEVPIHISNVSLCNKEGNRSQSKVKVKKDGERDLVYQMAAKKLSTVRLKNRIEVERTCLDYKKNLKKK